MFFLNSRLLLHPLTLIPRSSDLTGRGLRLSPMLISLIWVCICTSQTLVNGKSLSASHIHQSFRLFGMIYLVIRFANKLKNNGIMISSLRRRDYQNFINLWHPFPLSIESNQVLSNDLKIDIHEIMGLSNFGIMSPYSCSGAYQSCFNSLPLNPPDDRTCLTPILVDEKFRLVLLRPMRISTLGPFSTSLCLLTMTIISSNASPVDDSSTTRGTTCTILLRSYGLQVLIDPLSIYLCYLCVALMLTFVCCCYSILF